MASLSTLTVLFGFCVVFGRLDLLDEAAAETRTAQMSAGLLLRLAAAALAPAVLATLALTPLLVYAHVRALARADAGAGARARLVARLLSRATLGVTVVALLSGAAVRLGGAGGVRGVGGADDVGWPNEK
ncbi:hypothetical protein PVAP13_4KG099200 [Panicum virgatum]|uniref:Uncharacterized protein n=1 Tax=Panicum virgatum TaxID=38727 RepID=A0A8T0TIU6_PANVG|nr:hypothetical protein PVAP13_4KG099200 [Panicum virgatum]